MGGTLASAATPLAAQRGGATGPVLDIADWSYWWYGVERARLARGTVVDGTQMFVEHWIPRDVRHPYPIVLIHGGYEQGSDWLSWVNVFVARGYAVYVLDRPGQGRNPYQPFVHGLFDAQAPTFERVAEEMKLGVSDPRVAQSIASMNQPMANNAVTQALWKSRGALLLDDIGPAILITHGDGEVFARVTSEARPSLVKARLAVDSMQPSDSWIASNVDVITGTREGSTPNPESRTHEPQTCRPGRVLGRRPQEDDALRHDRAGQMFVQHDPSRAAASALDPVHAAARRART